MRSSAFTAAKVCLAAGCLAAAAMLFVPSPRGSDRYLAARDALRAGSSPAAGTLLAGNVPGPTRLRDVFGDPDRSAALGGPLAHRLAANDDAQAPLAGLDQPPNAAPEPTVTFRVAETDPPGRLVPEPTPDPTSPDVAGGGLAAEVRALRAEVLRLAQAGAPPTGDAGSNVSEELRRLTDELRNTERFRRLEDQLRELQSAGGGQPTPAPTDAAPAAVPHAVDPPLAAPNPDALVRALPSEAGEDRFDFQVESADVTQVLDSLGQMAGWNVVAGPGVAGTVTLNLRDVTIDEALDALLSPRDLVAERKDNLLFVVPRTDAVARTAAARTIVTKVYRPNYIAVKDLQALVTPLLTPTIGKNSVTSPSSVGLDLASTSAGGDSLSQRDALVVQDYPDVLQQVDEVVAEMDVPPLQVVIEAYILRVRLSDQMKLGVNFALLNSNNKQLVTTGSGAALATTTGFPGPGGRNSIVPPLPGFLVPAAGLRYGFLQGDVTGFIEALEGISETSLVASPSLRVLNKQKAELIIGQRLGYKTQTFNAQQTIENVQFLDVGTKLVLRPFAAPDGLVRMEIHPERSSGAIDENGIPQVDTTEVTTNVMVRDGSTVVIGGLIDETTQENLSQVPLLGSIPVLGAAFRNTTEELVRSELIVLITPRIVCDPVEESRGEVLRAESEQRAAYFSDNLSPLNRRNLGRMHVERAAELFARGRLAEAHDHVREALAIRKNDGDALRLKTQIEQAMYVRRRTMFGLPVDAAPVVPPDALPSEVIAVPPVPEACPPMPEGLPPQPPPAPAPELPSLGEKPADTPATGTPTGDATEPTADKE